MSSAYRYPAPSGPRRTGEGAEPDQADQFAGLAKLAALARTEGEQAPVPGPVDGALPPATVPAGTASPRLGRGDPRGAAESPARRGSAGRGSAGRDPAVRDPAGRPYQERPLAPSPHAAAPGRRQLAGP